MAGAWVLEWKETAVWFTIGASLRIEALDMPSKPLWCGVEVVWVLEGRVELLD